MFNDLTDVYEAMIDWPKRLDHEGPFYRRLFEQNETQSVVDTACGTGHHAAMFHQWGLRVEGADISPAMIDRARATFGESDDLRWSVRGFDEPMAASQPFDAAVCVGNSLPLAPDLPTIQRAVQQMLAALRPGGLLVIHTLNLWRLPDGPCTWQKRQFTTVPGLGEWLIAKGVHRCGDRGYVDWVLAALAGDRPIQTDCIPFWGLEAEQLDSMVRDAGGGAVHILGGYQHQPYHRRESVDLLLTAKKL
jgi:SAM-dependent methyltransferase